MKSLVRLLAPVTATAGLIVLAAMPATSPAQTTPARILPRIKVPATPVEVIKVPRLPEAEATPTPTVQSEDRVRVDSAEATPAPPPVRTRLGLPQIDATKVPKIEIKPRTRTPVAVPSTEQEGTTQAAPRRRIRVAVPAADGAEQVLVKPRTRVRIDQPAGSEAEPKPRVRAGTPTLGGSPIAVPSGGLAIQTVGLAQANCLFRPARNLEPLAKKPLVPGGQGVLEMVCIRGGRPFLMAFQFDVPNVKYPSTPIDAAKKFDDRGDRSIITYTPEPVGTTSAGRPLYKFASIREGEDNRVNISCIDPKHAISLSGSGDDPGFSIERWCTNGKTVQPLTFQVTDWLRPAVLGVSISPGNPNPPKYNSVWSFKYEGDTGQQESGTFLVRPGGTGGQISGPTTCKLGGSDLGSLYCTSDPVKGVVTTYLAYSLPEIRQQVGKMPAPHCETKVEAVHDANGWGHGGQGGSLKKFVRYYDYTVTTCITPRIAYRLLPGTVPAQYRTQTKGACYLASSAQIEFVNVVKITYSRAVEATTTGQGISLADVGTNKEGELYDIVEEGKTLSTNGTIDPDMDINYDGKFVPKFNITKVNAPCA